MSRKFCVIIVATVALLLGKALQANAASIGLVGSVLDTDGSFGIGLSSSVTGAAYWDELSPFFDPNGILSDFDDPQMNLEIVIADFSYSFLDDLAGGGLAFMDFGFSSGNLREISLFGGTGTDDWYFDIAFDDFSGANSFFITDPGSWYAIANVTGELAPVPEPGTIFLVGSGLVGLARMSRRRKKECSM